MAYKAEGRLHKVFDTEQKSEKFQAREFVIEITDGKFPQMVKFQLTQDKCAIIDDYSEGDQISVDFDLRGREWNDKYFTNLNAWRVARGGDEQSTDDVNSQFEAASSSGSNADFDDDIPF